MQQLPTFHDERGLLTVIEDCPFEIKRVFWIYDVPKEKERGGHSHDLCEQVLICMQGQVTVSIDDLAYWLTINETLYVKAGQIINLRNFTNDAVLLVLASEKYDPNDNIQKS